MYANWSHLCVELDEASSELHTFCANHTSPFPPTSFSLADQFYLEGFTSYAWQAWCTFCRNCVFESCLGTTNGAGTVIPPHPNATSVAHVSGAASKASKRTARPPYWGGTNITLRFEPTWGDIDILNQIIPRLAPSNASQLLAAFSSGNAPLKAMQKIRNATAHRNPETLADVSSLMSRYRAFSIQHPVQALFWIEPSSNDYLAIHVMDEMRDIALACIS